MTQQGRTQPAWYPMTEDDAFAVGESVAWARYHHQEPTAVYRSNAFRRDVRGRENRTALETAFAQGYRAEYARLEE